MLQKENELQWRMEIDIDAFRSDVYNVVSAIPKGRVATYGQIAWLLGRPQNSRLVGRVLRGASGSLPCHRVVNCQGRTAPGWNEQRSLLEAEGVKFKPNGNVNLSACQWKIK